MGLKKKAAVVGIPLAVLLTIIGGASLNLDFSQTTIGQIGDNFINNYITNELGIDIEQYRENCRAGTYEGTEADQYCDLVT